MTEQTGGSSRENNQVRPWVRYWARMIDVFFHFILIIFFIKIIGLSDYLLKLNKYLMFSLVLFAGCYIEAALLSTLGTTLGKYLLRVRVTNKDGSKLSYGAACMRSLYVFVCGYGLGISIVALFTMLNSYHKLTKTGSTFWDNKQGTVVRHEEIGGFRITIIAVLLIAVKLLMTWKTMLSR